MEFEINGKLRELKFGIGFVRKLNEIYSVERDGVAVDFGIGMAAIGLSQYNPATLSDVIRCSAQGNPSQKQVDDAIEKYAEKHGEINELFNEVNEAMGKSSIVKGTLEAFRNMN
ncbi:tail assembly chaperone [Allofustis seminis]|uniref:tail assembly chaperone n=1 Tax=Allofustis seminis TaxID=166939 RepID=UPI0003735357|nr:tail assembly chaperone [Allofustis seminis]